MNIDRGKEDFTREEEAELQNRLCAFKADNGYSWGRVAILTGTAQGTISQWAIGKYNGGQGSQKVAAEIWRFFLHNDEQDAIERDAPIVPAFQETETAKRIIGAMGWAQQGELAVVVGDPGLGKTAALDQYAATHPNAWKATMSPSSASVHSMLLRVLRATGLVRDGGPNHILAQLLRDRVANRNALLMIDEAQHLDPSALEELRHLHDETGCGLVLAGNREVLTRIEGESRAAAFAQLYSRTSLRIILSKPTRVDVEVLLNAWSVTAPKEREFLSGIAMAKGGGGVRTLTQTLKYATVSAMAEPEGVRVLDHFREAFAALSARTATA